MLNDKQHKNINQWQSLPDDVQDYVLSEEVNNAFTQLVKKYHLTDQQKAKISELVQNIYLGIEDVPIDEKDFVAFKLNSQQIMNLLGDVLNLYFIPLELKYKLGVLAYLRQIGQPVKPALNFDEVVSSFRQNIAQYDFSGKYDEHLPDKDQKIEGLKEVSVDELREEFETFLALPEVKQVSEKLSAHAQGSGETKETRNQKLGYEEVKSKFYDAINNEDRLGFVTALAMLFHSGRLKELFKDDERYIKFWRNRVLKDEGLEGVRKFDENSMKAEIFGKFIKYVLENRFKIPPEDSVLWGVYLSSLAHQAGDGLYEKLAYGDLKEQKFKWNF